ncbi:MAG: hypothetical protein GY910_11905 [bacterium]|nr:hypothetical protein [bacterium]
MPFKLVRVCLLMIFALGTGWAHARLPTATRADRGAEFVPDPQVADVASLGFDALFADYYWLQAVQVVGATDHVQEKTASHLGRLIDVVTTLNPHVGHPYRFAAVWLTYSPDQVRFANRLLRRAIEFHPDDWRNYFYLGFNEFYYLGHFEEAAAALSLAMELPGAPTYLPRLVARLKSQQGDIGVAEIFLRQLIETTSDDSEVVQLEAALDEIEIEYKARHIERARDAYRDLAGRDIESVDDLIRGRFRVLERLPSPEPDAIPDSLSRGSIWQIEPDTDRVVSSYLGKRYEVHFSGFDRERFESRGLEIERTDRQLGRGADRRDG